MLSKYQGRSLLYRMADYNQNFCKSVFYRPEELSFKGLEIIPTDRTQRVDEKNGSFV